MDKIHDSSQVADSHRWKMVTRVCPLERLGQSSNPSPWRRGQGSGTGLQEEEASRPECLGLGQDNYVAMHPCEPSLRELVKSKTDFPGHRFN